MSDLAEQQCQACQAGAAPLIGGALKKALQELPHWEVHQQPQPTLVRTYVFTNFSTALLFANKVGTLADAHNHHPSLIVEWGKVTVQWWTHKINNIHLTDAILAAKTDKLFTKNE